MSRDTNCVLQKKGLNHFWTSFFSPKVCVLNKKKKRSSSLDGPLHINWARQLRVIGLRDSVRSGGCLQRGWGRQGEPCPHWIFIHDTDKVEEGLMAIFFALFFRCPPPWKIFCRRPWLRAPWYRASTAWTWVRCSFCTSSQRPCHWPPVSGISTEFFPPNL